MSVIHIMKMQILSTYSRADSTETFWSSLKNAFLFICLYVNHLEKIVVVNTIYTNT